MGVGLKVEKNQLKDAYVVFASFSLICVAILFALAMKKIVETQQILSFDKLFEMGISIVVYSIGLIIFGVLLTYFTPRKYIDEENVSYQNLSVLSIGILMLLGAIFEELLFRGIVQNLIFAFSNSAWMSIIITTLLFVLFHFQYFKKPMMLFNIIVPSFVFCWVYAKTSNLFVPITVHFLMNLVMTLLFKYKLIEFKK